ncbi:TetR/AcrR family transcriptional regulator [Micromonospora sp. NPDC005171]|uniref:TetR/AcrR family transcriptional regulator n=1 Tax=Micromonospora sp. NPDC005171 TaxID=3156866 RepID=UPI0033B25862
MTAGTDKSADGPRRRDASATREAILNSAIEAFIRLGYDGAGVREVAGGAGVTAMLVNRYFGSKEQLFAEAVDRSFAPPTVINDDPSDLSERTATRLAARTSPDADDLDPFLLMLRSAANPRAAEIIRAGIEKHVGRRLADILPGPAAAPRAELLLALIAGVWLMRKVIGTPALAGMDQAALTRELRDLMQLLVNAQPATSGGDAAPGAISSSSKCTGFASN